MVNFGFLKNKVWQVDGLQLTVGGLLLVLLIAYLLWRRK